MNWDQAPVVSPGGSTAPPGASPRIQVQIGGTPPAPAASPDQAPADYQPTPGERIGLAFQGMDQATVPMGDIVRSAEGQRIQTQDAPMEMDRARENARARAERGGDFSIGRRVDAGVRAAAGGATLNFMDELAAGGDAMMQPLLGTGRPGATYDERYARNLNRQRAVDQVDAEDLPVTTIGAGITGAVASPAARVGASLRGGQAVSLAALYGGLGGFGQGEGVEDRANRGFWGGLTGAGLQLGINRLFGRAAAAPQPGAGQAAREAADNLGVELPRGATSDNMLVRRATEGALRVPYAGDPLIEAGQRATQQVGQAALRTADDIAGGGAVGASGRLSAGEAARQSIENWIRGAPAANPNGSRAMVDQAYDAVRNAMTNPGATTTLDNTARVAQQIASERAAARMGDSPAVRQILDAATDPQGLTFQGIQTLRRSIGEALNGGVLPAEISEAEMKLIYGALSSDLARAVQNGGGQNALAAFQNANRLAEEVARRREQLAAIIGVNRNNPASGEQVFDRILAMASERSAANLRRLYEARRAMEPADWQDVAGTIVQRIGRDQEGNWTPNLWRTAWGNISEEGRTLLFGPANSAHRRALDDIATISSRMVENTRLFGNTSGTSNMTGAAALGAGLMGNTLSTLAGLVGGRMLGNWLAQPATASSTANWMRAAQRVASDPSTRNIASYSLASRNLINTTGISTDVQQFLNLLNGPRRVAAEDQQVEGQ
jgi:hypothetical protein